jgi:alkylation response protein AidB-like acyl-CoA dehydrogenase
MNLEFSLEDEAFRREVRAFLADCLPESLSAKVKSGERLTKEDQEQWHTILAGRGWLAIHWPKAYGGTGWGAERRFIFEYECALAHAPRIVPFGVNMLGPVLIKYGSEDQKARWLPRILNGSDWWCQGYSEPGAGSDLAAVTTSAIRAHDAAGEHYLVNGQKTWTTQAHHANMIFCLVRTSTLARKQAGISFLLIDMKTPGVEVRPIITLDGEHEVNEVFFSNVRVPIDNRVGDEHGGWTYAKYLLTYERTNIAGVGFCFAALENLEQIATKRLKGGKPLDEHPLFAARMARLKIELENLKVTNLRVIAKAGSGNAPGPESSMLKIRGTEIRQEIISLTRRALGIDGRSDLSAAAHYFNARKLSIFGGSNEIQKNIIAKMILGLRDRDGL